MRYTYLSCLELGLGLKLELELEAEEASLLHRQADQPDVRGLQESCSGERLERGQGQLPLYRGLTSLIICSEINSAWHEVCDQVRTPMRKAATEATVSAKLNGVELVVLNRVRSREI